VATRPDTSQQVRVRAQAKWVRTSARKARLVLEHVRGRSVPEARTVLAFTPRAAAREIEKVLRSAVANAEANHQLVGDDCFVLAAYADDGPSLKRWRARARGRVARIRKRTCHITIELAGTPRAAGGGRRRARAQEPAAEQPPVEAPSEPSAEEPAAEAAAADEPQNEAAGAEEPEEQEEKPMRATRRKRTEEATA
jgi:ribosomal protein L22